MKIKSTQKMWRTLVRIEDKWPDIVTLIIPCFDVNLALCCPRKAIPPAIYSSMKKGKRYHVGCNIGADYPSEICFDGWENE